MGLAPDLGGVTVNDARLDIVVGEYENAQAEELLMGSLATGGVELDVDSVYDGPSFVGFGRSSTEHQSSSPRRKTVAQGGVECERVKGRPNVKIDFLAGTDVAFRTVRSRKPRETK